MGVLIIINKNAALAYIDGRKDYVGKLLTSYIYMLLCELLQHQQKCLENLLQLTETSILERSLAALFVSIVVAALL